MIYLNPKLKPIQSPTVLNFVNRLSRLEDFSHLDHIEWVLDGPTETVKTWTACYFLHLAHLAFPGLQTVILRSEKTTVYRTILKTFIQHILPYGLVERPDNIVSSHGGPNTPLWITYKNGGKLHIGGADDRREKVLGEEWDIAVYSQCEQSTSEYWERLSGRCTGRSGNLRANGDPVGILIGECNPDHYMHHLKQKENAGLLEMISFKHEDNPMIYYDGEYTNYGRRTLSGLKKRYSGYNYERLYEGKWVAAEGMVYEGFNEKDHMKTIRWGDIPADYQIITGRDYGTTVSSPFAHLAFAFSKERDDILELPKCQIYHSGKEVAEMGEWIKQIESQMQRFLGKRRMIRVADHDSQEQLILQNMGLPAEIADKEVLIGIEEVKSRLTDRSVTFNKDSLWHEVDVALTGKPQQLFEEWFRYRYKDEETQLKNIDKADYPIKGNDHALDVVRYIFRRLAVKRALYKPVRAKAIRKSTLPSYIR